MRTSRTTAGHSSLHLVLIILAALGMLGASSCITIPRGMYLSAPQELEGINPDLRRPGFWISRITQPDLVLLDATEAAALNQDIRSRLKLTMDLFADLQPYTPDKLSKRMENEAIRLEKAGLFDASGSKVPKEFWPPLKANLNLSPLADPDFQLPPPRWALAIHYTHQRILPTMVNLNAEQGDFEFDELQNSAYDIGTPFQILWTSTDGLWAFGRTAQSEGWIRLEDVAFTDQATLAAWLARPQGVVTSSKTDLYADPSRLGFLTWARMGTRLPLADPVQAVPPSPDMLPATAASPDTLPLALAIPTRDTEGNLVEKTAWVKAEDASPGFLPCTRRTVLEQAFKMLNAPYGWGDEYGEQDCSRFILMVWATMGIDLPRNSAAQGKCGTTISSFTKTDPEASRLSALESRTAPGALIRLNGHIMLYLGWFDGQPWVIHSTWAYREKTDSGERIRSINRNTVSNLNLGTGSKSGSLLQRIITIQELVPPPPPADSNP